MFALIERQRVHKRLPATRPAARGVLVIAPPRSIDRQDVAAIRRGRRRRPADSSALLAPTTASVSLVAASVAGGELATDTAVLQAPPAGRESRTATRIVEQPAALATLSGAVVVAALTMLIVGNSGMHLGQSPRAQMVLPPDSHINAILASYAESTMPGPAQLAVRIPNPQILEALKTGTYTVKSGDTISGIAKATGVSVETLISFNSIADVRLLTAGMTLKIPSMNGTLYTVRRGDNLAGIAKANGVKLNDILDANALQSGLIVPGQELFLPGAHMSRFAYRKALGTLFIWPTTGVITSPFGMRPDPFTGVSEFHNGIDIANVMGTPVLAAMDGTVAMVGRNRGYGNFIILNNGSGFQTLYGHLLKWLVQQGQSVSAGQEIGEMGSTGYATGPHLHFTIYKDSAPVNPLAYLPKR